MLFTSDGDVRKMYDAVLDDMGVREAPPRGLLHHWCAPVYGGLRVCDVWESRDLFDTFAKEKIGPLSAKNGFQAPMVEVAQVYEMVPGSTHVRKGIGFFVDFDGDTAQLLKQIDDANKRMNVSANPPEGLAFHCSTAAPRGVRIIDHWRSSEDFERFIDTRLGAILPTVGLPQPRITDFEIYNSLGSRVPTHA
jgi:hypothetical protein